MSCTVALDRTASNRTSAGHETQIAEELTTAPVTVARENVATPPRPVSCARAGCGRTFLLAGRRGQPRRFCSARCRAIAWSACHPRVALCPCGCGKVVTQPRTGRPRRFAEESCRKRQWERANRGKGQQSQPSQRAKEVGV